MVYVDIPGLSKDLDVKYRPPRVSLFPPSYRDRAFLRSIHRDVLRQTVHLKKDKDKKDVIVRITPAKTDAEGEAGNLATATQTEESHCYHVCSAHPHKEEHVKKHKHFHKCKACRCSNKCQESDADNSDEDSCSSDDSDSSDEECSKHKCHKHKKIKHTKSKSHKHKKEDEFDFKIPDSIRPFLPYPLSSPNAGLFWDKHSHQQHFIERPSLRKEDLPGWNLDHKLEAARQADERYVWNVLAQHGGNDRQTAFQWLADRDRHRQAKLARAAYGLADLSLDPRFDRTPLAFPPSRTYPHFQPPGANYGGCPCVNNHNNHNSYGQQNYQDFKKHEPSGNKWNPDGRQYTEPKAWNGNNACARCGAWHNPGHCAAASPNQWTSSGPEGFEKENKKDAMWSVGSHNNAEQDKGQQTTGDFQGQDNIDGGLGDMKYHPFFAGNSPKADFRRNDYTMAGANKQEMKSGDW